MDTLDRIINFSNNMRWFLCLKWQMN
jgi:hypothetical protein